jgi:sulfur-carrier protein adenylyltransferase/sulfurtransferase
MLAGQGFKEIYNLNGGMNAWDGLAAEGPVELNLDLIRGDESPWDIVRLAYGMEEALGRFYRIAREKTPDRAVAVLLDKLASIEDRHKTYLEELYATLGSDSTNAADSLGALAAPLMEGGFRLDDFMQQNERFLQSVPELLDLSMMLETQALDLYLRFSQKTEDETARNMLHRIADEEKGHLAALGRLREHAMEEVR